MHKNQVFLAVILFAVTSSYAATVTVDCDTGGTIQGAAETAKPGDTILVSGTCKEHVQIASETVRLTLDGQSKTTIEAPPKGDSIFIRGRDITVQGFTLTGGRDGIHLSGAAAGASANIFRNTIRKTGRHGIHLDHGSVGRIGKNTIDDVPGIGIEISESSAARIGWLIFTLEPNTIRNTGSHGILVTHASSARILGNTITGSKRSGILITKNSHAEVIGNTVSGSGESGVAATFGGGVNFGREGAPAFKMGDNVTTAENKNQLFGVSCAVGGFVEGPQGTLDGVKGNKSVADGCVDRIR